MKTEKETQEAQIKEVADYLYEKAAAFIATKDESLIGVIRDILDCRSTLIFKQRAGRRNRGEDF